MTGFVTNPTAGDVHVNVPLTNFAQKFLQNMDYFVSTRAFPNLPVTKQSDLYYTFDRDSFYRDGAALRADATESQGGGFELSTDPYFAHVYAMHKNVSDRQRANQDSVIRLDESATQFVMHQLMIRRERVFVGDLFTAAQWGDYTVPSVNWSDAASDPIVDIRTGIRTVQEMTGYRPNKMLLNRASYDVLLDNDAILSRIEGGAMSNTPAIVQKQLLAALFELQEIFVMDSVVTTTGRGEATQSTSFIGGDNALLYYAPDSVNIQEPTAAVQFSWTGLLGSTENGIRIKRFRMEQLESDRIEGQMAFDFKQTSSELGYFFSDVTSA